jgi:hypothetical protein
VDAGGVVVLFPALRKIALGLVKADCRGIQGRSKCGQLQHGYRRFAGYNDARFDGHHREGRARANRRT